MSTAEKLRLTEHEYLRRERAADFRSEFYRGEMFAMAGAKRAHNLLTQSLSRLIGNALAGGSCEVYASDMRVKVSATGLYTYPDVVVVCGEPRFEDDVLDTLLNPKVLVEVLSDSTEAYDRGVKFAQYRQLESLQEYVLISQASAQIDVYRREAEGRWSLTDAASLDAMLELQSLGLQIPLDEIYRQVSFLPTPPPNQ